MTEVTDKDGPIAVLGAGAWGSTIAWMLNQAGKDVRLWSRNQEKLALIEKEKTFKDPLPVCFDDRLKINSSLDEAIDRVPIIVVACTSQSMSAMASLLQESFLGNLSDQDEPPVIVSAVKGLELSSLKTMSSVIKEKIPNAKVVSLSGPNLAYEIRSGLPSASSVASTELETAQRAQRALSTNKFRLYATTDLIGCELGGTLKNVIAIAAGVSDGLKLGVNAKAALITRGLAEIVRLAKSLGARESTLFGLSGIGDMIATCEGPLSRNYRVGYLMAEDKSLEEAIEIIGSTAEGVQTTYAVCELSKKKSIEMPIAHQVQKTLKGACSPKESIMILMQRPLANE